MSNTPVNAPTDAHINIALLGTASQSTEYPHLPASLVIDGNYNGYFNGNSASATREGFDDPWWKVDFHGDAIINKIKVWNRRDCCSERLEDAEVQILDTNEIVVATEKIGISKDEISFEFNFDNVEGSAVAVRIKKNNQVLSLAEVEVFGIMKWTLLHKRGSTKLGKTSENLWMSINKGSYVRRICHSCSRNSHKEIIYKRLSSKGGIDFRDLLLDNWHDCINILGLDFNLFSTFADAKNDQNPWSWCSYNIAGIGFPRDCGPSGWGGENWNSLSREGETDFAYYLLTAN